MIRNLKSKTCTELCRSIENLKSEGSTERAGESRQSNTVRREW